MPYRFWGQRSRSQCINYWKWFPAHNYFLFTPIIMKLHMQTPHESRMCLEKLSPRGVFVPLGQPRSSLNWLDFANRIKFHKCILIFKIVNGLSPPYLQDLFRQIKSSSTYSLRSAEEENLLLPGANLEIFKKLLQFSVVCIWNSLPPHIKKSKSLSNFKETCQKYMLNCSKFFTLMYFLPVTNVDDLMINIFVVCIVYTVFVIFSHIVYVLKASRETSIVLIELPSLNKEFFIIIIIFSAHWQHNFHIEYKMRLLLRCIHHFKTDLIYNMYHMRISGNEPSSVILSQTKYR